MEGEVKEPSMTVQALYDYILQHMTAEDALMKLLGSAVINYDKLKFSMPEEAIHPELLIACCAMDLNWQLAVEKSAKPGQTVRGMVIGTAEYMDTIFPKSDKNETERSVQKKQKKDENRTESKD